MRLSVSVSGATLAVTFAGETMARKHSLPYDAAATAATARAIVDVLARGNRARTLSDKNLEDLKHHGEALWRTLVPAELHDELLRGDSLALELDEALVAVPWELMFDGTQFLGRRLSVGRIVATRQAASRRRAAHRRHADSRARHGGDPKGDLPEVRAEGEAIIDELEKHATVKARLSTAPDRAFALRYLKDYDIVHFAGHADYVAADAGQERLDARRRQARRRRNRHARRRTADADDRLRQRLPVGPHRRRGTATRRRCSGWRTRSSRRACATTSARSGRWSTASRRSSPAEFYRHLTDGKAIGAAVRHARAAVVERAGETALAWASYVLYGDPDVRPLHRPEHKGKLSIPSGLKIAARASAPWKRPAATGARAVGGAIDRVERRLPAWVPAALGGVAAGLVGVTVAAWLMHRKPAPLDGKPTLAGIAVLPLSTGDSANAQSQARDLEGCLPLQLSADHAAVVAPEKMMTLQAQTNGVYDKDSARAFGLAVGAEWVLFGNIAGGVAHLTVVAVVDDRTDLRGSLSRRRPAHRLRPIRRRDCRAPRRRAAEAVAGAATEGRGTAFALRRGMKSIILSLVVIAALPARAQPTLRLLPGVEELTSARHQQAVGRNLIIATAVLQGVGLGLAGITGTGAFGNRDGAITAYGFAAIMGFTSLALLPAGIVYWVRGARHERLALIGTTIAPDRAAQYERAGTVLLYLAGAFGTAATVLAVADMYRVGNGVTESTIATFTAGSALTAIGAPLAIAGHRHAHVQLGIGSVRGSF